MTTVSKIVIIKATKNRNKATREKDEMTAAESIINATHPWCPQHMTKGAVSEYETVTYSW